MARSPKTPELRSPDRQPRLAGWRIRLVALVVPLVAVGAVFMLLTLRAQADHARQAQVEFTELAGDAKTGNALRWRAMAERRVSRKLAAEARALRTRIDGRFARLSVVDADDENLPRVAEERATRLQHEAQHDPLTGLGNRRKLMRDLADELAVAHTGKRLPVGRLSAAA